MSAAARESRCRTRRQRALWSVGFVGVIAMNSLSRKKLMSAKKTKRGLAEREGDREDDDEPPGHAHAGIDRKQAGAMFGIAAAVQGPVGVEGAGGGEEREADEKDAVGLLNGESESHGCARR